MPSTLEFTTLRVGLIRIESQGHLFESDVRLLLGSDGAYRVLQGGNLETLRSLDEAVQRVERPSDLSPEIRYSIHWRSTTEALEDGQSACPVCGAVAYTIEGFPLIVCPACRMELADALGRPLNAENPAVSGGLLLRYRDQGESYRGDQYFIRGRPCRVTEKQFGGVAAHLLA